MSSEILKMNAIELRQKAVEIKKRLAETRFDKATGRLIDTSAPKKLRRELAKVLTRQGQISAR